MELSEVRRKGERLTLRKSGNYFYYFGEIKGQRGVVFLIKKEMWANVVEIKAVTERIAV